MRALLVSLLMALALFGVSATGGRAPLPQTHFPAQAQAQALSTWAHSADSATFTPSGEQARSLLTTGRQARRGPGFQPLPFLLPVPPQLTLPVAELTDHRILRYAATRGARPLAHGPRAPPV